MSMQVFDLDWQSYFPPAFALSLLGLALGAGIAHFRFRGQSLASAGTETVSPGAWRKLRRLAGVLAVIVAAVALLERLGFSTSTGRLLVTILAVTAVWLTAQGRVPEAPPLLRQWWQDYLPKNQDLAAFFLSMGVFSAAIQYSGFGDRLTELCAGHSGLLGPLVPPLLPLAIVAFSLVGLHPFVSVLMVGPILAGLPLPVTPLQLGLAMSLGCCLSYMLSPFAGLIPDALPRASGAAPAHVPPGEPPVRHPLPPAGDPGHHMALLRDVRILNCRDPKEVNLQHDWFFQSAPTKFEWRR